MGSIPIPPTSGPPNYKKGCFIFNLYSENVQHLRKIINQINKDINSSLKNADTFQIDMQTKLLALAYSAWSEAQFSQILYTPNIFLDSEISEILGVKQSGIVAGWKRLVKISLNKVHATPTEKKNKNKQLNTYIDTYIFKQSQIRNKIAHGEWIKAIESTEERTIDFNQRLQNLNVVDIMIEFQVHTYLGKILRDLVQSPNKGFSQNYDANITNLTDFLSKSATWNLTSKKNQLSKKPKKLFCQNCRNLVFHCSH